MSERFEHLELPIHVRGLDRQKQKPGKVSGPLPRTDEERKAISEIQVQQFANLKQSFSKDKARYREYLDPNLIFKLEIVTKNINEDKLQQNLRSMNIEVISPAPDKKGFWVVFSEDEEAKKFHEKLQLYVAEDQFKYFNAFGQLIEIPPEDKIGERLQERGLNDHEIAYLDVEIWRMEDDRLNNFINGLEKLVNSREGRITDKLIKQSFCLLRIKANKSTVDELLPLREIASIDRPPQPYITYELLTTPLEAVNIGKSPPDDATAIAILDSGIFSNHPLLQNAVGDEIAIGTRYSNNIDDNKPVDDVGHGTKVSGIAVYGDIKQCIEGKVFQPEVWILSAKVMYAEQNPITGIIEAKYDEEELLEHQLETAIRECKQRQNCKVVNLSLGNASKKMFGHKKQFNLAALVDELAKELKLVFVVSTGNFGEYRDKGFPDSYPNYLLENEEDVKIIDPATSALSITVGSVTQPYGPLNRYYHEGDLFFSPADTQYPSPFTCVGPGYQGMIKPEVVEEGGNIIEDRHMGVPNEGGKLITLNPNWLSDGKLFSIDYGTSFSTPKVANYVARLFNKYPHASPNLIKALLFSSAQIPEDRPTPLAEIDLKSPDEKLMELLQIYGYGKPNFDKSAFSDSSRALLINEGHLKPNSIDVYYVYLPNEFVEIKGNKKLSVTLVYDPLVNKNRIDYMGCSMEFHLFKNVEVDEVVRNYRPIAGALVENALTDEDIVPQPFKNKEIKLHPGVNLRKKGVHQKGIIEYSERPGLDADQPLVLVVICQNRWIKEDIEYMQDYAVIVAAEHSMNIDLLNRVRARNLVRVRATLGRT